MSTLTMSSGATGRSTLNPNAPLFVPMAFQQVEDYSPEWWDLVKTTAWYRDYWFHQHQDQEPLNQHEDDDVVNLLPDSFDLGIEDQLAFGEVGFQGSASYQAVGAEFEAFSVGMQGEQFNNGIGDDVEKLAWNLNSKSPRSRVSIEQAPRREKAVQSVAPKYSPRRIIQQPR